MTFPLVCFCNEIPRPIVAVLKLLHAVAVVFVLILCFLGVYEFPYTSEDQAPLIHGRRRPPPSDGLRPDTMKKRLPPVEFARLAAERSQLKTAHEDDDDATCRVCLETLETTDEVRRLGNCTHAFHRGCIDRWIDLGEMTCPLCRSHLLPRRRLGLLAGRQLG